MVRDFCKVVLCPPSGYLINDNAQLCTAHVDGTWQAQRNLFAQGYSLSPPEKLQKRQI